MTFLFLFLCRYVFLWAVPCALATLQPPCKYCCRAGCKGDHS